MILSMFNLVADRMTYFKILYMLLEKWWTRQDPLPLARKRTGGVSDTFHDGCLGGKLWGSRAGGHWKQGDFLGSFPTVCEDDGVGFHEKADLAIQ